MVQTQVQFTEEQIEALERLASRRNVTIDEVIREAVDVVIRANEVQYTEKQKQRAIDAAGRYHSGQNDVSSQHDEHLTDIYQQ